MNIELTEEITNEISAYDQVKLERESLETSRAQWIKERDVLIEKIAEADVILSTPLPDNSELVEKAYTCICAQLKSQQ